MSNKVCILTSVHPPFDIRIFHKGAKSLVKAGYDVTIIAQHDKNEMVDGVKIIPLFKPKNRFERLTKTVWHVFRKALQINAQIYHFHDPELIPIGIFLKLYGKKVIYDVHEDVPRQILSKDYLSLAIRNPISWAISILEWLGSKIFNVILPATPKIAERFPASKTVIIQNFPIVTELLNHSPTPYVERPKSFIYVGGIARIRGAEEMVHAFHLLADIPGVRLDLAGDFSPTSLKDSLQMLPEWASVHYHGNISREEVAHFLGCARAGLVMLHPTLSYLDSYPIKMFEYMASGLPIIASDFPLWRQIINGTGCGLLVDPMDTIAIAAAMKWILDHPAEAEAMGRRGQQAVLNKYNWSIEENKLCKLYKTLI